MSIEDSHQKRFKVRYIRLYDLFPRINVDKLGILFVEKLVMRQSLQPRPKRALRRQYPSYHFMLDEEWAQKSTNKGWQVGNSLFQKGFLALAPFYRMNYTRHYGKASSSESSFYLTSPAMLDHDGKSVIPGLLSTDGRNCMNVASWVRLVWSTGGDSTRLAKKWKRAQAPNVAGQYQVSSHQIFFRRATEADDCMESNPLSSARSSSRQAIFCIGGF